MKLIVVERDEFTVMYSQELDREIEVMLTEKYGGDHPVERRGSIFWVDDRFADALVEILARKNPGCDVKVFTLEKVGHCPAGEFVAKQVTKDGTLPA